MASGRGGIEEELGTGGDNSWNSFTAVSHIISKKGNVSPGRSAGESEV